MPSGSRRRSSLCTARYLQAHPLAVAAEGGIVGIPRNINKNFQAWREGPNVWICPTNRIGPVYQFVFEKSDWRFDGPVGILRPRGEIVPTSDAARRGAVVARLIRVGSQIDDRPFTAA